MEMKDYLLSKLTMKNEFNIALSEGERYYLQPVIEFYFTGKLVGKQRHRKGRFGNNYTPNETVQFERTIGQLALVARQIQKIHEPFSHDVAVDMKFYFKNRLHMPDEDNVVKSIFDGMQRIIYHNDKQVAEHSVKRIIDPNATEGAWIRVIPMGDTK